MIVRNARVRWGAAVLAGGLAVGVLAGAPAAAAGSEIGEQAWWYTALKIKENHKISTGKGVTIALIDTPIDPRVPELKGQDVVPVTNVCGGKATGSGEYASHGSSMAANILGSGRGTATGGIGVAGIAPDVTLRAYPNDSSAEPGLQCESDQAAAAAAAIDAAVADGARIINFAQGTSGEKPALTAAVRRAIAAGVIVVAATGNAPIASTVDYPAAIPGVVAVVAVDRNAKPWSGNVAGNREAFVIAGPGVDVPVAGFDGDVWKSTGVFTGTSEATSLVSGGLALVMAKYPKATGNQIIQQLIHTPLGRDGFVRDTTTGYGVMSVTAMLASDPSRWPDVNPLLPAGSDAAAATSGPPVAGPEVPGSLVAAPTPAESDGGLPGWVPPAAGLAVLAVVVGAVVTMRGGRSGGRRAQGT